MYFFAPCMSVLEIAESKNIYKIVNAIKHI